jgi:group I intron endonuclease
LLSGKVYIGSAVNLFKRFNEHLGGRNSYLHLQSAIALYGLDNFEFFVIEFITDSTLLIAAEQRYMDMVSPDSRYN